MSSTLAPAAAKLALLGGTPVGKITYPKFPTFTDRAIERAADMLRQGKLFGLGRSHVPEIGEAEGVISRYHGNRPVLATSSGHAALQSALAGLEICGGDEVITTPYTWGASISCILHQNAIPVFVDIERETGLIDPTQIEAAITPRTKAILAVHLFGQPANLKRLRRTAARRMAPRSTACVSARSAMPPAFPAWAARCSQRPRPVTWSRHTNGFTGRGQ
jgi:dTDP-4-amino-4,6-dideoxygalactose transaminase